MLTAVVLGATAATGLTAPDAPRPKPSIQSASTPHLSVRATLPDTEVSPGTTVSLTFAITPKPHMHVYAPGSEYRAVAVRLEPQPGLNVHDIAYPEAQPYFFAGLNEQVPVYAQPFQLVLDMTLGETPDQQAQLGTRGRLTLKSTLEYQACDERICYLPTSVPFTWTLKIRPRPEHS